MSVNESVGWFDRLLTFPEHFVYRIGERVRNLPLLLRLLLASLCVAIAARVSPFVQLNGTDVRICYFGTAVAMGLCVIGGPIYSVAALLGLCAGSRLTSVTSGDYAVLYISLVATVAVAVSSWLVRRAHLNVCRLDKVGDLLLYVLLVILLPIAIFLGGICLYSTYGVLDSSFGDFTSGLGLMLGRLAVASMGLSLAIIVPVIGWLEHFDRSAVRGFVRLGIFVVCALACIVPLCKMQGLQELAVEEQVFAGNAEMLCRLTSQQIALRLEAVRLAENKILSWGAHAANVKELERVFARVIEDENLGSWNFLSYMRVVPENERAAYEKNFFAIKSNAEGAQDSRGSRTYYPLTLYRSYKNSSIAHDVPLGTDMQYLSGWSDLLISPRDGRLISDPELRFHNDLRYVNMGGNLLISKCCFVREHALGVITVGISYEDIINRILREYAGLPLGLNAYLTEYNEVGREFCELLQSWNFEQAYLFSHIAKIYPYNSADIPTLKIEFSGNPQNGFFMLRAFDGLMGFMALLAVSCLIGNNMLSRYDIIDETVRKQLQDLDKTERYNSLIMASMRDLMFTTDSDGNILIANDAACKVLGMPLADIVGKNIHAITHRGLQCLRERSCVFVRYWKEVRDFQREGRTDAEFLHRIMRGVIVNKDNVPINFEGDFSVMRHNNSLTVLATIRNIENELKLNKMRENYIATLSHEMRTPLSCIKGSVDMFLKHSSKMIEGSGSLTQVGLNMIQVASRNVENLNRLVNDVLLCDSIENESLRMEVKPQEVAPIVTKVLDNLKPMAIEAGIELKAGTLAGVVLCDEMRLNQILVNLVSNAVRHSPENSAITVEAKRKDGDVVFSVSDQGEGIPLEKISSVFDRFTTAHVKGHCKRSGFGLGLAISRGLVLAHKGKIWVESTPGQGSTFFFTIPLTDIATTSDKDSSVATDASGDHSPVATDASGDHSPVAADASGGHSPAAP